MKSRIENFLGQIPRHKGYFISGFADGEGSFNTSFRVRDDYLLGWKITPVFNISQKERSILGLIKRYLQCGTIRPRNDGVWVYEVDNRTALHEQIVPFFKTFPLLSQKKKKDFQRFQRILNLLNTHRSLTLPDLEALLDIVDEIESKASRKYTSQEILERAREFWTRNQEKIHRRNSFTKNPQRLHAKISLESENEDSDLD